MTTTMTVKPETPWAAQKSVIRGKLLQIVFKPKREYGADIQKHTEDFVSLSETPRTTQCPAWTQPELTLT